MDGPAVTTPKDQKIKKQHNKGGGGGGGREEKRGRTEGKEGRAGGAEVENPT